MEPSAAYGYDSVLHQSLETLSLDSKQPSDYPTTAKSKDHDRSSSLPPSIRYRGMGGESFYLGGDSAMMLGIDGASISDASSSQRSSGSTGDAARQANRVDFTSGQIIRELKGHKRGVWRLVQLTSEKIISASYDHSALVWDTHTSKSIKTFKHKGEVLSLEIGDNKIFTGSSDGYLKIWNAENFEQEGRVQEPEHHRTGFYSIAYIGAGRIATGACQMPNHHSGRWEHNVKLWNVSEERFVTNLAGHTGGISKIVKLEDAHIVSCSADKTLRVWNTLNYSCEATLEGHTDYIYSMCKIDNHQGMSCSRDRSVRLWDFERCEGIGLLSDDKLDSAGIAHTSTIYDVTAIQPNVFATASRDGFVKVWDLRTRTKIKLFNLESEDGHLYSLCPIGNQRLAVGTQGKGRRGKEDGNIHIFEFGRN